MKCGTCAYFENDAHECHRYAPQPKSEDMKAEWPRVEASDWCGEYREDPEKVERKTA